MRPFCGDPVTSFGRAEGERKAWEGVGGLVERCPDCAPLHLVDLTDDDRATILGGLMDLAERLQGEGGAALSELFRRRGLRAFEAEATAAE